MSRARTVAAFSILAATVGALGLGVQAYTTFGKWGTSKVDFYINPANADVTPAAAQAALMAGAGVWTGQSNAAFEFVHAGAASDTATANDGRNVVFFRNTTNGSAIASTYSWTNSGRLIDADIIFWDGGFRFFTGASGCGGSNAAYIEDIAAHEFGHALGLHHTTVSGATMFSGYSTCSMAPRTIEPDDVAGVEALYPPTATSNAAPAVTISTPSSGSSFSEGATVTFSGSANDTEDGALSGGLIWVSSRDGQIGTGSSFQRVLSAGTHTITARVTDSAGVTSQAQRSLTVEAPVSGTVDGALVLTGRGYKSTPTSSVVLTWSGSSASMIDVYRDGARIAIAPNTGTYTDTLRAQRKYTVNYKVCVATTTTCSAKVTLRF